MYTTIRYFTDLQDNNHAYNEGDVFPRVGMEVSQARLNELSGSNNKQGRPLIKFVEDVAEEKKEVEDDFSKHMNPPEEPDGGEATKYDYTKNDIMRMNKAKLIELATELGIKGADDMTGGQLKPQIIKRLGL